MRKSKFSEKQIIEVLRDIEAGAPVVDTLRERGVSKDTYYKWKRRYSGMKQNDIKKAKRFRKREC
jgi:putative transposase